MSATYDEIDVPIHRLLLDPNNFRFQDELGYRIADEARFHEESVQRRALQKLREGGIDELKASIRENGFLSFDRIVVRDYAAREGFYVVLEGNRRVAALRSLLDDHEAGIVIRDDVLRTMDAVPVVCVSADDDPSIYLSMMGLRHVSGVKRWGPYQSSKLISEMRDEHGMDLAEIGPRLGMSVREVQRRYRAFRALRQYEEDEEFGEFAERKQYPMFHEAVAQPKVREWLGWNDEHMRFDNDENRERFYRLISPETNDDEDRREPKISRSEEMRKLKLILQSEEATAVLLDHDRTFDQALGTAQQEELRSAWRSQVAEAVAALRTIGAIDLANMPPEDVDRIGSLGETVTQLLKARQQLVHDA